jgi:hypothetical protein
MFVFPKLAHLLHRRMQGEHNACAPKEKVNER